MPDQKHAAPQVKHPVSDQKQATPDLKHAALQVKHATSHVSGGGGYLGGGVKENYKFLKNKRVKLQTSPSPNSILTTHRGGCL